MSDHEESSREIYDAIVIGLGPAGVAAFTSLYQNGLKVLPLEAGNRIGGRINSVPFGDCIIDLGAEWCHGEKNNVVFEMFKNSDGPVCSDNPGISSIIFCDSNGSLIPEDLSNKMSLLCCEVTEVGREEMTHNYDSLGENFVSVYEKLLTSDNYSDVPRTVADQTMEWFHKFENSLEASDTWYDTAGNSYSEYWECEGDHLLHWNGKGYKTVIDKMLNNCPESVKMIIDKHLNKEVININYENQDGETIRVKCKDNSTYLTKHVIVTVSLGVLKEKYSSLFTPSLPSTKINSIKHLEIGTVNKMFLRFDKRWWNDNMVWVGFLWKEEHKNRLPEEDQWLLDVFGFNANDSEPKVLCFWVVGPNSRYMETLSIEKVQKGICFLLDMFLGKSFKIPAPCEMLRTTWYSNPHFRGSYTFRSMNSEKYGATSHVLSMPILNRDEAPIICFAGESTSPHYYSTVHGAIESGLRESQRISDYIKLKNSIMSNCGVIKKKVVVIGGGTAGLAATKTLIENGIFDIALLESTDRLGGRIHSVQVGNGKFIELGAQWIHGENNKFNQYVKKHNLITNTISYEGEGSFLRNDGFEYPSELIAKVSKVVSDILEECELFHQKEENVNFSIGEYLKNEFDKYLNKNVDLNEIGLWNEIFNWHVKFHCIDNACISLNDLSAKEWGVYDFDGGNSQSHISFKNGYSSFVDKIASEIPENIIKLNMKVKKIVWDNNDKVSIYCLGNNVYEADHVIITVPLGVLKYSHEDMFKPNLPDEHIRAIKSIGFGPIGKIFLQFDENWWGDKKGFQLTWKKDEFEKNKTIADWTKYISGFDVLTVGPANTLIGWISSEGNKMVQDLSDSLVIQHCHDLFVKFTKCESVPKPTCIYRSSWDNNLNIRGGFCNITRECDRTKSGPKCLSKPIYNSSGKMKLLFAGEACHPSFFSTVHGAFESGIQQAEVLCKSNESLTQNISKL